MHGPDVLCSLFSRRMILPSGEGPATLTVDDRRITSLVAGDKPTHPECRDVGDAVVMPGLIDTHVHINEPGRTDWEGFASATRAAVAGGITTLVDMPLNAIPATTTLAGLQAKRAAARSQCSTDVGFWAGCVPGNELELEALWNAGVLGFKAFLAPSGVDEFEAVTTQDLERAAPILSRLQAPLLVHAEDARVLEHADCTREATLPDERRSYARYLASRPEEAEAVAVDFLIDLAQRHQLRVHIVHLANGNLLPKLAAARSRGVTISAETCPHYLGFSAEAISDGDTAFKCAPPIRSTDHREKLWRGLAGGTLDLIATDHSPSPPGLKHLDDGDFDAAWGGIASLQLLLPAVWTEARERGHSPHDLWRWLCSGPAHLAGLDPHRGTLAVGQRADLVVWDPQEAFTVQGKKLYHRHSTTPWEGRELYGVVLATFLGGRQVFARGDGVLDPPSGHLIQR